MSRASRGRVSLALTATAALLLFRCGGSGDDGSGDPTPAPPSVTGVVDTGVKTVSGAIYVGAISTPAAGYEIWLLDHTKRSYTRGIVSDTGIFDFSLDSFPVGDVFSFHLLDHMQHVAAVDVSPNVAGTQTAFTYQGGYGFVMRDLIVPVTKRGDVDRSIDVVTGSVGGGFSLRNDLTVAFDDVATPAHAKTVALGSQLFVIDPTTALNSFILKSQNPRAYSRDLAALSRIGVYVSSDADDRFLGGDVVEAGAWRESARDIDVTATNGADGPLWSAREFGLSVVSKRELSASVIVGRVPVGDEVAMIRLQPADGTPEVLVPRRIGAVIGAPPKVVAASMDGTSPAAIDYSSVSAANGLTRAFCLKNDVALSLAPPSAIDARDLTGTFDRVVVAIDYLGIDSNGHLVELQPPASAFAKPYNSEDVSAYGVGSQADWVPSSRTYTLKLGAADAAAATLFVKVPKALLLTKVGAAGVTYLRLRLTLRSSTSASASGIGFWLRVGC